MVFGITGGSGSGKSSVSAIFEKLGVDIIDTDLIAREVTQFGTPCLKELAEAFGNDILNSDGTLERQTLASIAFTDTDKTKILNRITHKYIKACILKRIENSQADIIAIDGAVIIGSDIEPICDFLISIIADKEIRIERIIKRDKLTRAQALERLDAQPNEEFYRNHSQYIIINNDTVEELEDGILNLFNELNEV